MVNLMHLFCIYFVSCPAGRWLMVQLDFLIIMTHVHDYSSHSHTVRSPRTQFVLFDVFFLITYCIQLATGYKFWFSCSLGIGFCGVFSPRPACSVDMNIEHQHKLSFSSYEFLPLSIHTLMSEHARMDKQKKLTFSEICKT